MAGAYLMFIGEDARYKHQYVRWEADVAVENDCTVIGANLYRRGEFDPDRTPTVIRDLGAVSVAFSAQTIAHPLEDPVPHQSGNWRYSSEFYRRLGYPVTCSTDSRPTPVWRKPRA